jgi:DNA repair exonuclease SbcCD ATPase subunit
MELIQIEAEINNLKIQYQRASGRLDELKAQQSDKEQNLVQAKKDVELWQQVQLLLGWVSEESREQLKERIQETVTAALQAILCNDQIQFNIEIKTINGKPSAEWSVVSCYGDKAVSANPEDARGGGISDIVSLALRLSMLELSRPKPQGAVFLDEVGKHISAEFAPNVASFLQQYAEKTGRQIILITHQVALAEVADVRYQVKQVNGISEVNGG